MERGLLKNNALVSVVVTCYNHGDYVKESLESIFQQTYPNIELLVFNDGSTDQSERVIKEALKDSPFERSEYFYHENKGVVITKNLAFEQVSGDYLVFIDSDDTIAADYIAKLVEVAEENTADLVYTPLVDMETGDIIQEAKPFSLEELFVGNFIHASSLMRRSAVQHVRFDEKLNREKLEDYDFYLQLLTSQDALALPCEDAILHYRMNHDSRSGHRDLKSYYRVYNYILSKYLTRFPVEVSHALDHHFDALTNLDIEHSINQEYVEVFLSETEQFPDEPQYRFKINDEDEVTFSVPQGVSFIQVRPSNIPSFYQEFHLQITDYGTEILPVLSNGILAQGSAVFEEFYPMIDYQVNFTQDETVTLNYKRYNIKDIVAKDFIGKMLMRDKQKLLLETDALNNRIRDLEKALAQTEKVLAQAQNEYNQVVNSRRWRYTDTIINTFRRNK